MDFALIPGFPENADEETFGLFQPSGSDVRRDSGQSRTWIVFMWGGFRLHDGRLGALGIGSSGTVGIGDQKLDIALQSRSPRPLISAFQGQIEEKTRRPQISARNGVAKDLVAENSIGIGRAPANQASSPLLAEARDANFEFVVAYHECGRWRLPRAGCVDNLSFLDLATNSKEDDLAIELMERRPSSRPAGCRVSFGRLRRREESFLMTGGWSDSGCVTGRSFSYLDGERSLLVTEGGRPIDGVTRFFRCGFRAEDDP